MKYMLESGRIIKAHRDKYRGIDVPPMSEGTRQQVDRILEKLSWEVPDFVYGGDGEVIGFIGSFNKAARAAIADLRSFGCRIDENATTWVTTIGSSDSTLEDEDLEDAANGDNPWLYLGYIGSYARPFTGITVCGHIANSLMSQ